jgi:flavin-dependent dehydrogenase
LRAQIANEADLLIVGGGPAGLLAAAYMAERWRIALIDCGVLGRTTKYWVTSECRLKMHGLTHCTLNKPPGLVAGTFLGGTVRTARDFAVVDDQALLGTLVGRCRAAGVQFEEGCSLLNLAWTKDHIDSQTTTGRYRTRLVIDATGGLSPIAATFRLHRIDGFYAVYGVLAVDFHFCGAFFESFDPYQRHQRFFYNIAVAGIGSRKLEKAPRPRNSFAVNMRSGDQPIVVFEAPRLSDRVALKNPDEEIRRVVSMLARHPDML